MKKIARIAKRIPSSLLRFYRRARIFFEPVRKEYRARFGKSLTEWLLHHQREIIFGKCTWMGMRAMKNPLDAWIYQEIIYEVKPEIIIEIGSAEGGSTLYLANLLDLLGKGTIISVDITRSKYKLKHPRVIAVTGDSSSAEVLEKVSGFSAGKSTLVIHDGGHTKTQVLKDLRAYAGFVSVNSYFIVEDGIIDLFNPGDGIGTEEEGPLAAVLEFLKENRGFIVDKQRERYILTYNPRGFLKRIK